MSLESFFFDSFCDTTLFDFLMFFLYILYKYFLYKISLCLASIPDDSVLLFLYSCSISFFTRFLEAQ